jgi:LysM repeat protein
MKASMMRIFMVLLFALAACSGEDQQPLQTPPPKVVQPIKPSTADVEKPTTTLAEEKKPEVGEKTQMEKRAPSAEKPALVSKPEPEDKKAASEEPTTTQAKKKEKDEPGFYVVKKGDSLSSIAARTEVLKDPLKWPILLRLNRDKLGEWTAGEDLPDRDLPQGMKLKMVTAREARASFKKETSGLWVVNVLSAATRAEIVPPAVTLVKQGYPVYIVRANVQGKNYMRLRLGFFKNKSEADEVGKKIKEQMTFQDSWTAKADKEEYEEVAGFFKTIEKH